MTQGIRGNGNRAGKGFSRHIIQGWYSLSGPTHPATSSSPQAAATHYSDLPFLTVNHEHYELATSGSLCKLMTGGAVIIAGHPRFKDPVLEELARNSGPAAAVAHAYENGPGCIFSQIFGSFCCAVVDTRNDRVLIGIDRLGQQSLYYSDAGDRLFFGHSASSVLAQDNREHGLLNQGVYNYVYFHMVPGPGTVFRGLKKLPAAHYIDYSDGCFQVANYWKPSFSEATGDTFESLSDRLMQTLRSAVKNCLPRQGTVGSFLSGGLDSSTVTGLLAEISDRQAEAYSIGFSAEGYDEMAFARITARHFGVKLNEYYVTPQDVVDALPIIATSYDEPFGNSSALPAYFCARMAVENNVTTLFAGDGGDELFAGNERYIKQRVFQHYARVPGILRKGLLEPAIRAMPDSLPLVSKASSYIAQANTPLPDRLQSYNFLHRHAASDIFSASFLSDVDVTEPIELLRSIYQKPDDASELNRMLYLDWQITLADNDLRKVSHMCDVAGVDVVYPMLDDALVELSALVPSSWKIKGANLRYFFKQATKGWLPTETINKTKQGFGLPFGVWMQTYTPLRELAYDNLQSLKKRGFIRADFIDRTISMHQSEHAAYYGELVWIFTVFELWLQGRQEWEISKLA